MAQLSLLAAALLCLACGEQGADAADEEATVSALVVGSTAEMWGLLTVPRGGGPAELRHVGVPDSILWTGSTDLPVARDLRRLGDVMVVLLTENGRVLRYDPLEDSVGQVLRLSPDATFADVSGAYATLLDSDHRIVHVVTPAGLSEYAASEDVSWAAAFDGGLVLRTASEPSRLLLIDQETDEVILDAATGEPPPLVTAWGQRLVVVAEDERHLRIFATDDGSLVGEVDMENSIRSLAASPSSHEIYVATDDPPRLHRVSRFSLDVREIGEYATSIVDLRSGLFGGALLVRAEDGIGEIAAGQSAWRSLAGSWRSDLPLSLPGGRTIVLRDDEAHLRGFVEPSEQVLAGGSPAWWVPVRWNAGGGGPPSLTEPNLEAQSGRADRTGDRVAQPRGSDDAAPADQTIEQAGHYAIVASARQPAGVEALLARLAEGGYPTRLHRFPDEAGNDWFRGLVGPYPTRARALAAARQLRREHDLQAWVTELGRSE
ncbi:MAG: SPOR domain-containing protein [Gemmatimonadota bacterium]|nr:SPOR domain-containing protein [Gemmatimonadota bacterium]